MTHDFFGKLQKTVWHMVHTAKLYVQLYILKPSAAPFLIPFFTAGSLEKGIKNGAARKIFSTSYFLLKETDL